MEILFIIMLSSFSQVLSQKWIDPHDMNTNVKHHLKRSASTGDHIYKNEDCNVNTEESNSLVYLKRVINLLLNSADINKSDALEYRGHLHLKINNEDLKFLKSFSSMEKVNINDLRKLDTILSKSVERSYLDGVSDMLSSAQEKFYQLASDQNFLPLLALAFCFPYVAYNLFRSNFSLGYAFRYLVFMVVMIDFVQRYQQLSQEAQEHNMNLKYSSKCDTSKMSWAEYFKFLTIVIIIALSISRVVIAGNIAGHEDCEKKVVSLLEVGLNQVKSIIIVPLAAVGTGMGEFGSELWKNLPFPWNILIFPIMLIFCAILVAIVMTTVNNTPFRFNILHLLHLEFGDRKQTITGKTLDKLLDAVNHRPMLQEVQSPIDKTPPKIGNTKKSVEIVTENMEVELNEQKEPQVFTSQKEVVTEKPKDEKASPSPGNSDENKTLTDSSV